MPSGAFLQISWASSIARSNCCPKGTTSCTKPIRRASWASNRSQRNRWYIALPHPVRVRYRKCAPPNGAIPRLDSTCWNCVLSAATTMSAASIISRPTVNVRPCTAATMGFVQRRPSAKGSTFPGSRGLAVALGPKNFGMSRPAVVSAPAEQNTATHRSSSSSNTVRWSLSCSIISGEYEFFLAWLSTVMTAMCPSVRIVTSPGLLSVLISSPLVGRFVWCSDRGGAAVDGEDLSGDVLAGLADQKQRRTLEVILVADTPLRDALQDRVEPVFKRPARHVRREEARGQRVDVDSVRRPLGGQRTSEVDDGCLAGVVGDGLRRLRGVAFHAGDRGQVEDPPVAGRDHRSLADLLGQQEHRAHVEVHHLVPRSQRQVLGRCAPGRPGVVDQDVDLADPIEGRVGQPEYRAVAAAGGGDPLGLDPLPHQLLLSTLESLGLSRTDHNTGALRTEGLGDLQAQPARAAGDKGGAAFEAEQVGDGGGHGRDPLLILDGMVRRRSLRRP